MADIAGGEITSWGFDQAKRYYGLGEQIIYEQLPSGGGATSAVITLGEFTNPLTRLFYKNVKIAAAIELDGLWVELMAARTIPAQSSFEIADCPRHGGRLRILADSEIEAECVFTSQPESILAEKSAARAASEERQKSATEKLADALQSMSKTTAAALVVGVAAFVYFKASAAKEIAKKAL